MRQSKTSPRRRCFKSWQPLTRGRRVETGFLKNSKEITDDSVHWLAPYAADQDKGTVHIPPTLFATHAADVVRPQWVAALSQIEGRL
jgi:hypothetical protein